MSRVLIVVSTLILSASILYVFTRPLPTVAAEPPQSAHVLVDIPQLPETLEFAGERVPLENYDTRESLIKEILITQNMHSRTSLTMLLTTRYFPIIEPILEAQGVPLDFKYLCMAESSLTPNIASGAGAAGLWQLMPAVGKENGMVVGGGVDQRYHIEMATLAACKHLKSSYARFGSWTLAAAAYNLGPTGVKTRMDKQQIEYYYDLYLPEETMRYMFRILSFKLLCADPEAFGYHIDQDEYFAPLTEYKIVTINDKVIDWSKFAIANGTTYKMLRELNHWIRDYTYTNSAARTFEVKVPIEGFREAE